MKVGLLGNLLVAVVALAVGASGALWLSKRQTQTAFAPVSYPLQGSPQALARNLFPPLAQALSERVVEVQSEGNAQDPGAPMKIEVEFRMRAKGAGNLGVCVADNLSVDLREDASRKGKATTVLSPTGDVRLSQTYRIVGDTTPDRQWTERYAAELDRDCAALGPGLEFFFKDDAVDWRTVTDMLPALGSLATSTGPVRPTIRCDAEAAGDMEACRDPRGLLKTLTPGQLFFVGAVDNCRPGQSCIEFNYLAGRPVDGPGSRPLAWSVTAKGDYQGAYPTGFGKIRLSDVTIVAH